MVKLNRNAITIIMALIVMTGCNKVNEDTLPEETGDSNPTLTFSQFATISGEFQGENVGFAGNPDSDKLFLAYREAADLGFVNEVLIKYDLSGASERLAWRSTIIGGADRAVHFYDGNVNVLHNLGIFGYHSDLSQNPSWTTHSPSIFRFGSAVHQGELYVVGGFKSEDHITTQEYNEIRKWNPLTQLYESIAEIPETRTYTSTVALNNKLYSFGGLDALINASNHDDLLIYDMGSGQFSDVEMPEVVHKIFTCAYKDKILVAGQIWNEPVDPDNPPTIGMFFQVFDPATNTFQELDTNLTNENSNAIHDIAVIGNQVFVIYGDAHVVDPRPWTIQKATLNF